MLQQELRAAGSILSACNMVPLTSLLPRLSHSSRSPLIRRLLANGALKRYLQTRGAITRDVGQSLSASWSHAHAAGKVPHAISACTAPFTSGRLLMSTGFAAGAARRGLHSSACTRSPGVLSGRNHVPVALTSGFMSMSSWRSVLDQMATEFHTCQEVAMRAWHLSWPPPISIPWTSLEALYRSSMSWLPSLPGKMANPGRSCKRCSY